MRMACLPQGGAKRLADFRYCQKFYEKTLWNISKRNGNPPP